MEYADDGPGFAWKDFETSKSLTTVSQATNPFQPIPLSKTPGPSLMTIPSELRVAILKYLLVFDQDVNVVQFLRHAYDLYTIILSKKQ